MNDYAHAYYQLDFLRELDKQSEVFFYGPNYEYFKKEDTIEDIITKSKFDKNEIVLLFAHSFLIDDASQPIQDSNIDFSKINLPKYLILNKEYSRYNEKLDWAKQNKILKIFTHHTDNEQISKDAGGIPTIFWPFAVNPNLFKFSNIKFKDRKYDLAFTGILQNNLKEDTQTDLRVKILKEIFFLFRKKVYFKKFKYSKLNIFYNFFSDEYLNPKYKRLDDPEYIELQQNSKLFLNTLSAGNLISTRFFENMASGTIVFCEYSDLYNKIFPNDIIIQFDKSLKDFKSRLFEVTHDFNKLEETARRARKFIEEKHTWEIRVTELLNNLN